MSELEAKVIETFGDVIQVKDLMDISLVTNEDCMDCDQVHKCPL